MQAENIIYRLLGDYFATEYISTIILIITCLLVNIIQTNGISHVIAKLIRSIEKKSKEDAYVFFSYFVVLSVLYLFFYYIYKIYQNKLLTKLRQWIRHQLTKMLLIKNNEQMAQMNFIKMNSPINRLSSICFMISSDIITFLLPTVMFLLVISAFFSYTYPLVGAAFVLGNIGIFAYLYFVWGQMLEKNEVYEECAVKSETYLLEILNNIDKIVYRGQTTHEVAVFENMTNQTIEKAYAFYSNVNIHGTVINILVYLIIFAFIGYCIQLYFNRKIGGVLFITFLTIILLYRDKMGTVTQQIPDFVEFLGRSNSVMKYFTEMKWTEFKEFEPRTLSFSEVVFENVSFGYKSEGGDKPPVFNQWNATIPLHKKIIGITGVSGKGKSTFAKLLLKMYDYSGNIFIDGVNIKDVGADYIRQNMVYVNQNAKLFDKKIVENMLYGCEEPELCEVRLKAIFERYPKIRELYKDMDIYEKSAGSLGEGLSGGQRQVVNIVGGLIHPAPIVILDEPTNALDGDLKREVLRLIRETSKEKQSILIITHDKEVYPLFESTVSLNR
jgi:ABC-type multidrug transport system fused ATPase/permease subunit